MRIPQLSALLVAAALAGAPSTVAFAEPAPVARSAPGRATAPTPPASPTAPSDAEQYAAREAADKSVAEFQGGSGVLWIGGGTVTVVLLVVILVILL